MRAFTLMVCAPADVAMAAAPAAAMSKRKAIIGYSWNSHTRRALYEPANHRRRTARADSAFCDAARTHAVLNLSLAGESQRQRTTRGTRPRGVRSLVSAYHVPGRETRHLRRPLTGRAPRGMSSGRAGLLLVCSRRRIRRRCPARRRGTPGEKTRAVAGAAGVTLTYPFEGAPTPGEARVIAPGVRWLRMPLPLAGLNHINLWALDDGAGLTLVDTGMQTPETGEH